METMHVPQSARSALFIRSWGGFTAPEFGRGERGGGERENSSQPLCSLPREYFFVPSVFHALSS
jgi:hypothetical protein